MSVWPEGFALISVSFCTNNARKDKNIAVVWQKFKNIAENYLENRQIRQKVLTTVQSCRILTWW